MKKKYKNTLYPSVSLILISFILWNQFLIFGVNANTDFNTALELGTQIYEVKKYDERMSQFRDFKKEAENILEKLDIQEESNIIELGTGTGEIAINLSSKCKSITAIDISNNRNGGIKMGNRPLSYCLLFVIDSHFVNHQLYEMSTTKE